MLHWKHPKGGIGIFVMIFLRALQVTAQDILKSIIFFPVWWYTGGVVAVIEYLITQVKSLSQSFRLTVLFRYLLKPMYGQTDIWSRILSVPVRIVHFLILLVVTCAYTVFLSLLVMVWIVLPIIVIVALLYHLELVSL